MSTLTKTKVELISHVVPYSEIEEFGHKILTLQVENHFVNKGMKDPEHTELFLFTPKELEVLSKMGLVSVTTKKEGRMYTQEVVGYAVVIPSEVKVKNNVMRDIFKKLSSTKKKFFVVDVFMSQHTEGTGRAILRMLKKLEDNIEAGTKVFCPIYSGSKNFEKVVEIFDLNFEYGPEQTLETKIGVIHLPYKILTA